MKSLVKVLDLAASLLLWSAVVFLIAQLLLIAYAPLALYTLLVSLSVVWLIVRNSEKSLSNDNK